MRGPGIFRMLELAVGMSMAAPMFVVGVEFVRSGQVLFGLGCVGAGAFALFFPSFLLRRIGGPRTWIRRRFGAGAETEEAEGSSSALDRFRR